MSLTTINRCANDDALGQRFRAAYAKDGVEQPDPAWYAKRWLIAADPQMETPYETAINNGVTNPGADTGIISDALVEQMAAAYPYIAPAGMIVPPPVR